MTNVSWKVSVKCKNCRHISEVFFPTTRLLPHRWIVLIINSFLMLNHNLKFLMQVNLLLDVWKMQLETLHGITYRVVDVSYKQFFCTTKRRFVSTLTNKIPFLRAHVYAILAQEKQLNFPKITYFSLCGWHLRWPPHPSFESFGEEGGPPGRAQFIRTNCHCSVNTFMWYWNKC